MVGGFPTSVEVFELKVHPEGVESPVRPVWPMRCLVTRAEVEVVTEMVSGARTPIGTHFSAVVSPAEPFAADTEVRWWSPRGSSMVQAGDWVSVDWTEEGMSVDVLDDPSDVRLDDPDA